MKIEKIQNGTSKFFLMVSIDMSIREAACWCSEYKKSYYFDLISFHNSLLLCHVIFISPFFENTKSPSPSGTLAIQILLNFLLMRSIRKKISYGGNINIAEANQLFLSFTSGFFVKSTWNCKLQVYIFFKNFLNGLFRGSQCKKMESNLIPLCITFH